ncbi:MAG TPA: winged helix-turn-helix domain-containing protein [Dehalococcoidia bacterium]|jgi:predicted transcriptional regulator|nr:winged helix-turn-helix domain-containing protein [Dehalococcoidia bacterium]
MNQRRSNIEIIADMLRVGENGAGKTEIMYSANMSYTQIQKYLGFLLSRGFINKVEVGNPVVTYQVTEKGGELLRNISTIVEILEFRNGNGA